MSRQQGFTLPELLVVSGFIVVGLFISLLLINPVDVSLRRATAERQLHVATLVQAISKYKADTGRLPQGIGSTELIISSDEGDADLCTALVPKYLKDLPVDPELNKDVPYDTCTDADSYLIGYTVARNDDGSVTVFAPLADKNAKIQATSKP